jgi:hypothetical protein
MIDHNAALMGRLEQRRCHREQPARAGRRARNVGVATEVVVGEVQTLQHRLGCSDMGHEGLPGERSRGHQHLSNGQAQMVERGCDNIPRKPITEGQVKCDASGKTVFRYTDGKLRHYKPSDSERVGSNWGAQRSWTVRGFPRRPLTEPVKQSSSRRIVGRISQAS